jgi:hypothetical protein
MRPASPSMSGSVTQMWKKPLFQYSSGGSRRCDGGDNCVRTSLARSVVHNVPRIFIVSPAEKDRLPHLLVVGPIGECDLANKLWCHPLDLFRGLLVDFRRAICR